MSRMIALLFAAGLIGAALLGGFVSARLAPSPAQAAPVQAFAPPVAVSALPVPNTVFSTGAGAQKVADIGAFNLRADGSLVEITHQGRILVDSASGFSGVLFELRVDDLGGADNLGQFHIPVAGSTNETGREVTAVFSGIWPNLEAGNHTLSLWAYGFGQSGQAEGIINPGNWPTSVVFVKEFPPFGASYLPVIQN